MLGDEHFFADLFGRFAEPVSPLDDEVLSLSFEHMLVLSMLVTLETDSCSDILPRKRVNRNIAAHDEPLYEVCRVREPLFQLLAGEGTLLQLVVVPRPLRPVFFERDESD